MLVCFSRRADRPLVFDVGLAEMFDPAAGDSQLLGVPALSQWYSQVLEREICKAPEQYWWVHRRWRKPPERGAAKKRERRSAA
jgi:KDO2-lipid IV(A) lauroyltransferase